VTDEALVSRTRPAAGEPEGLLVLFHGRGADELDLLPLVDVLDPERRFLGVTARGPLALPPGGRHWYVVRDIGYPDPATFLASYERAAGWLNTLAADVGVPDERIVLGGFSQGAVMAYALALGRDRPRPGAIVAFSGFIPTVEGFELDLGRPPPPTAIGHGRFDPVISVDWARQARQLLERAGAPVVHRESPLPHAIDGAFAVEVGAWLARVVPASRRVGTTR
jgi:phospholipase/carboxylesterase